MTRRLDALIAEHIDGWQWEETWFAGESSSRLLCKAGHRPGEYPRYSEFISAAWRVVEKMKDSDAMPSWGLAWANGKWIVSWETDDPNNIFGFNEATAPTAPLAICLAALRAVGVDEATINEAMEE